MAEGRVKLNPLLRKSSQQVLDGIVNFGSDGSDRSSEYVARIKRIMKKLEEISQRIDNLASTL